MPRITHALFAFTLLLTLLALNPRAAAQCEGRWLPGLGVPGVDGIISAVTRWDPDGAGPEPELLVIGGAFTMAGSTPARNLAAWDGTTFRDLGGGVGNSGSLNEGVAALAVMPDNSLVVGGVFLQAGSIAAQGVARWDGSAWTAMPGLVGFPSDASIGWVRALLVTPAGELIAGGIFYSSGSPASAGVARWDGQTWRAMGAGVGTVFALSMDAAGRVVAAGQGFSGNIAAWDQTSWVRLGSGTDGFITALKLLPDNSLIIGGSFSTAGGVNCGNIARWNGANYSPVGGLSGTVRAIDVLPNGDIVAGGFFSGVAPTAIRGVARWNGTAWTRFGTGTSDGVTTSAGVRALLVLPDASIVIGGAFTLASDNPAIGLARWNGAAWSSYTQGWDQPPAHFTMLPSGEVLMGGKFRTPAGLASPNFIRWNGASFTPAGATLTNGNVLALHTTADGRVFVGGDFTAINSVSRPRIAQLNGTQWTGVGIGANNPVNTFTSLPTGQLIAGGTFTAIGGVSTTAIGVWNGTAWSSLGSQFQPTTQGDLTIRALALLPDGSLVVGGRFGGVSPQLPASNIARYDGAAWHAMGTGFNSWVLSLTVDSTGAPVAAGIFTNPGAPSPNGPARWNGSTWEALGPDSAPFANGPIVTMHDGGIVVTASSPTARLLRWDGAAWSPLGPTPNFTPTSLFVHPSGELLIGGSFTTVGNVASARFARWSPANQPWFAIHPQPQLTTCAQPATFSVTPASGYDNLSYRWQMEDPLAPTGWRDLADGGLFFIDGPIFGAATGSTTPDLTITISVNPGPLNVRCLLSNPCFTRESNPATLSTFLCCGSSDFNGDGDYGTDADIEAFFACLAGNCCDTCYAGGSDFNADGDYGTDADIEAFFRVLAGGAC